MLVDRAAAAVSVSVAIVGGTCTFGKTTLFRDLDLTLAAGSWTCLLGPSGIGKTSLIRLILESTRLRGQARAIGSGVVACDDGHPLRGRVAYMAQRDLLLPWLTVRDNVLLGRRLRGEAIDTPARGRANALIEAVGMQDAAGLRPDALSGGMRQRAALARTLFEDRPVVLMDEPFSAVDAITRVRLQDLAATLLRGRTVLLVTHDPLEALRLGHRIFVMAGRPARLGEPLHAPGNPPRPVDDPGVLALQGELLRRLAAAHS